MTASERECKCNDCYPAKESLSFAVRVAIALAALLSLPVGSTAATIALGGISFNTLIPSGGGSPGVTNFEIDNFTGAYALPSDFPAIANLTFQNSQLVLTEQGGTQVTIALGDLTPGANTPNVLDFSSTLDLVSATFTATLSSETFALSDGTTFEATSSQISSEVTPSSAATLTPDLDFSLIVVSGSSVPTSVPEPRSLCLACMAVIGVIACGLRKRSLF